MNVLNREFTFKEKLLFLFLSLVLVAFAYYYFVDQPVRTAISTANAESDNLQIELTAAKTRLNELQKKQDELDAMDKSKGSMPSYNGIKGEMTVLNDIMESAESYSITFSNVTRDGDQIRRNFSVSFTAEDYETAKEILSSISTSKYRCIINNVTCSSTNRVSTNLGGYYVNGKYYSYDTEDYRTNDIEYGTVSVSFTATFYETMVGGTADSGLPQDSAKSTDSYYED